MVIRAETPPNTARLAGFRKEPNVKDQTTSPLSAADLRDIAAAAFRGTQKAARRGDTGMATASAQTAFEAASAARRLGKTAAARDAAEFAVSALWALVLDDENPAASARSFAAGGMADEAAASSAAETMRREMAAKVEAAIVARLDWTAFMALFGVDGDEPTPAAAMTPAAVEVAVEATREALQEAQEACAARETETTPEGKARQAEIASNAAANAKTHAAAAQKAARGQNAQGHVEAHHAVWMANRAAIVARLMEQWNRRESRDAARSRFLSR